VRSVARAGIQKEVARSRAREMERREFILAVIT
jgi:hypothetical protein